MLKINGIAKSLEIGVDSQAVLICYFGSIPKQRIRWQIRSRSSSEQISSTFFGNPLISFLHPPIIPITLPTALIQVQYQHPIFLFLIYLLLLLIMHIHIDIIHNIQLPINIFFQFYLISDIV